MNEDLSQKLEDEVRRLPQTKKMYHAALKDYVQFVVDFKKDTVTVIASKDTYDKHDGTFNPSHAAVGSIKMRASDLRDMMHAFAREWVERQMEREEVPALVEMHAESMVEHAIKECLEKGWNDEGTTRTIQKIITGKVRDLVSKQVADRFDIQVDVRLVEKK